MNRDYNGAIDQGTTSSGFLLFDKHGKEIASSQKEHSQTFPRPMGPPGLKSPSAGSLETSRQRSSVRPALAGEV